MSSIAGETQEHFRTCQKRLGGRGKLGISALLWSPGGERLDQMGFNEDDRFPMASIVKVPLCMLIASEVADGALSLAEEIAIDSASASPGMVGNPLDQLYFLPFDRARTLTIRQLMEFMIRHSDNTAADAMLHRLGGICTLRNFLRGLQIEEISVQRTMHELLAYYYGFPPRQARSFVSILSTASRLLHAFRCKADREEHLVRTREDTCTPRAMAHLLNILTMNPKYALVYSEMQRCATNDRRITEGLKEYLDLVESFGHKTGTVGAIANDVGIIQFKNGCTAALAVMTCYSTARMPVRDQQIALATRAVVHQWKTAQLLEQEAN